jgi:Arc/MetJ-type ribon-helix-helix transcriptional regulator
MPTLTLELPEETAAALQEAVAAGRYRTAQDAVLDALAIWERREHAHDRPDDSSLEDAYGIAIENGLAAACAKALANGPGPVLRREEIWAIARGEAPRRG